MQACALAHARLLSYFWCRRTCTLAQHHEPDFIIASNTKHRISHIFTCACVFACIYAIYTSRIERDRQIERKREMGVVVYVCSSICGVLSAALRSPRRVLYVGRWPIAGRQRVVRSVKFALRYMNDGIHSFYLHPPSKHPGERMRGWAEKERERIQRVSAIYFRPYS